VLDRVLEALDAGALVADAHARSVVGAAEILELGGVIKRLGAIIEQRPHDCARKHRSDYRAVFGRDAVEQRRGASAAGRLVLGNDGRRTGNEAVEMARDHAGVDVIAAADVAADDEIDGLAGVEIRGVDRSGREPRDHRCGRSQSTARLQSQQTHFPVSWAVNLSHRSAPVIAADCAGPTCPRRR
jgi:hypothetical protein